jgi:hypothetical protein
MNKKLKNYRHGEIGLFGLDKLPENLTKSDSKIIVKGSHGNNHSIDNGELYFKQVDNFIFGYLVAKNTCLLHKEHGDIFSKNNKIKKATIANGIYELRKQQEFINNELKPVID